MTETHATWGDVIAMSALFVGLLVVFIAIRRSRR